MLKCSFGSAPVNGKCKPLFEGTTGLFIDIPFTLSVIWSRAEYRMTDKTRKLRKLGENIIDHFLNEARLERTELQCPYCYLEIQMAADISKHGVRSVKGNDVNSDVTNTNTDVSENKLEDDVNHETKGGVSSVTLENNRHEEQVEAIDYTSPAFMLKAALFTVANCQLQNIFDIASDLFGTVINIEKQGETELQLKVGLLKDTDVPTNQTFKTLKKVDNDKIQCKVKGAHTLKDEKFCPKIPITYNEFVPHLTRDNSELISSFFQKKHIETGEATEVCVDTYYERLQSIDFQILSQGSVIITDMRLFLLYFIYLLYLYIILRQ